MYNASQTILKALNSVFNQTYDGEIEVIIINDGSIDDSLDVVRNYIQDNGIENVKIINQLNKGVSSARNAGLKIAKGKYIALLDSDDIWLPNKLAVQMSVFQQNPSIDFLGCNRNGECIKSVLWKPIRYLTKISPRLLLVKFVFVVPTVIFKSCILNTVGFFDETQKFAEEGNFFIRIANKFNCYLLNESLVITGDGKPHFGAIGLSSNLHEMEKGELLNIKLAKKLGVINKYMYLFFVVFSLCKYLRRIIIVKFLR